MDEGNIVHPSHCQRKFTPYFAKELLRHARKIFRRIRKLEKLPTPDVFQDEAMVFGRGERVQIRNNVGM